MKEAEHISLELDNAAHIYPAVRNASLTGVHHLGVVLKDRVEVSVLDKALQTILPRFPYFQVNLRPGFFKYMLETDPYLQVSPQPAGIPCRTFDPGKGMFRVVYGERKIAVEFSHIITDGGGAMEFLRSLLYEYLNSKEQISIACPECKSRDNPLEPGEYEDSFDRFARASKLRMEKSTKAFHLPFRNDDHFHVTQISMSRTELSGKAKEFGVSVTGFLTAVYFKALQDIYYHFEKDRDDRCPNILRVQVPVNLRSIFPSGTMRNFTLYALPEADMSSGPYALDDFTKIVETGLRSGHSKKVLQDKVDRYNAAVRHPLVRSVPLLFRNMFFRRLYVHGVNRYSGVFSNLGAIKFGNEMDHFIERAIAIPPPPHRLSMVNCSAIGFGKEVILCFGNVSGSKKFEEAFSACLSASGLALNYLDDATNDNSGKTP